MKRKYAWSAHDTHRSDLSDRLKMNDRVLTTLMDLNCCDPNTYDDEEEVKVEEEKKKKKMKRGAVMKRMNEEILKLGKNPRYAIAPIPLVGWDCEQTCEMKADIIGKHPGVFLFNAPIDSGKSVLIQNLLVKPEFYGRKPHYPPNRTCYFDEIYYFSRSVDPTLTETVPLLNEDYLEHLKEAQEAEYALAAKNKKPGVKLKKPVWHKRVYSHPTPEDVQLILDKCNADVKENRREKALKVLMLWDDMLSETQFLESTPAKTVYYALRHSGLSLWATAQSFNQMPRKMRRQANNVFALNGLDAAEKLLMAESYMPVWADSKKHAYNVLNDLLSEQYAFAYFKRSSRHPAAMWRNKEFQIVIPNEPKWTNAIAKVYSDKKCPKEEKENPHSKNPKEHLKWQPSLPTQLQTATP